jgi:hypothetical protein
MIIADGHGDHTRAPMSDLTASLSTLVKLAGLVDTDEKTAPPNFKRCGPARYLDSRQGSAHPSVNL